MANRQKIYVGMSGGVDSSLAAALLVEQGHDVTGVYMKNWTEDLPGAICPWREDASDAKRVAVQLGIPLKVYDFQKEYKQKVVDYMVAEYQAGRTPNPDIVCNQEVKFKLFLETARSEGADMIATGHYAKVAASRQFPAASKKQTTTSAKRLATAYQLHTAADKDKDQTYFLYRVSEQALSKTLFPLGGYLKIEVRAEAKKRGLATAQRKESMGICFVGKVGIKEFLNQYVKTEPGPIIDQAGQEIGQHDGAIFYTIGQRHGLDVGGGLPYYVVRKDMKTNTVYVTTDLADKELWGKQVALEAMHWINDPPKHRDPLKVRWRYRGPLIKCMLKGNKLTFKEEQRAVAPGQSTVFYSGKLCLGGGVISSVK